MTLHIPAHPKHSKYNPTYTIEEAIDLLERDVYKEAWQYRSLPMLPMFNREPSSNREKIFYLSDSPEVRSKESREWAQYAFFCTFGQPKDHEYIARKYVEYMKLYDNRYF